MRPFPWHAKKRLVVPLRSGVAAQHDVPAPREAVYLLRHARCRAWYGWQHLMQTERDR
jgi:hypothetical protein